MYDCLIKENEYVGLHDCRIDHIKCNNQNIVFEFSNGYYVLENKEPKLTGSAEMKCHIIDEEIDGISVFIYRKDSSGKVVREDWSDNFIAAVNDGTFEFEFVTTYRSYQHILFKGYVWFDVTPYHMECEIELHTDDIFYSWNEK